MSTTTPPVIILTGASRGTGLAILTHLLSPTLSPRPRILTISRTTPPALAHLLNLHTSHLVHLPADISDPTTAPSAISLALQTWSRIDSLIINHAVLAPVSRVADAQLAQWEEAFRTNFFGAVGLVAAALPELRRRGGRVVFVSSGAAVTAYEGWGCYGASKAALNHFCMTVGMEEKDAGVVAVAVRPGVIDTQMQEDIREKHGEGMGASHERFVKLKEEGKLLRPEQPGNVIARLALEAEPCLSGKFLNWNDEQLAKYQDKVDP